MQIVLREKIHQLGEIGEIVKVKNGFARNFLIPKGKAVPATTENIALVESQREELERVANESLGAARDRAKHLDGLVVEIPVKVTEEGNLYGSIGVQELSTAISMASGIDIEKKEIQLSEGPIRDLGEFEIHIGLHADVVPVVKINIIEEA